MYFNLRLGVLNSNDPFLPFPHCEIDFPDILSSFSWWVFHFWKKDDIFVFFFTNINIYWHSIDSSQILPFNFPLLHWMYLRISSEQNSVTPCGALTKAFPSSLPLIGGWWSRDFYTLLWLVKDLAMPWVPSFASSHTWTGL